MSDQQPGRGRYLFAVVRGLTPERLNDFHGLRGAPLEIVEHDDLQAVVCDVDLAEFGEEALPRNLEDLTWLEEVARCHHDVVYAAATAGAVAPMRLVTILSDDESVRTRIRNLYAELSEALTRVDGRHEWSVKVYVPREEPAETVGSTRPSSGAAYLQRKREHAARRRTSSEQHLQSADEIHQTLTGYVAATRVLPPQDPQLTGRTDSMILNGAYLVPDQDADGFQALVRRLDEVYGRFEFEMKGPWPPYSFATLD